MFGKRDVLMLLIFFSVEAHFPEDDETPDLPDRIREDHVRTRPVPPQLLPHSGDVTPLVVMMMVDCAVGPPLRSAVQPGSHRMVTPAGLGLVSGPLLPPNDDSDQPRGHPVPTALEAYAAHRGPGGERTSPCGYLRVPVNGGALRGIAGRHQVGQEGVGEGGGFQGWGFGEVVCGAGAMVMGLTAVPGTEAPAVGTRSELLEFVLKHLKAKRKKI